MSERKVLNKYYPPDFDPSKIPRVKQEKNRQFTVRLMAPFNMRCTTCGEYIYKGKKFNARKEDVENETYLGVRIYRFYIKCTRCLSEISFKTDPVNTDYVVEAGATRNFMALKLAEEAAKREIEAVKEEERTNPMKLLENRTKASRNEIEMVETLEELKELNKRKQTLNYDAIINVYEKERQAELDRQVNEDEALIESVFGEKTDEGLRIRRIRDDDEDEGLPALKIPKIVKEKPTEILVGSIAPKSTITKSKLGNLVKLKKPGNKEANNVEQKKDDSSKDGNVQLPDENKRAEEINKALLVGPSATVGSSGEVKKHGILNLLGAYSDTDSDSSGN
uniref:Splicing factor YJU2 n=1 Tax=Lynceus sp. MCZ IZ 141354 TaxID=1930659 RepID=A0A9N6ZG36_9CRUS|nr:EOG090X0G3U [Lynceus sp. MCZ IZ 141354]